jgi:hypothetical protein
MPTSHAAIYDAGAGWFDMPATYDAAALTVAVAAMTAVTPRQPATMGRS